MEAVKKLFEDLTNNHIVIVAWAVIVVVLLFILVLRSEGFLGEIRSMPIATQRNNELLGVGQNVRFSSEDSSTNRGNNAISAHYNSEHMVGSMEAPVIQSSVLPVGVDVTDYRLASGNAPGQEAFSGRKQFIEPFTVDSKLKQTMAGL